jgi:hypothetical protein
MNEHVRDGATGLAGVRGVLTLRNRRLRVTVLSILAVATLLLMVLAPIVEAIEPLAGVAVGVATAVLLLGILLDHGAEVEEEFGSLTRRVGEVRDRLEAHENRLKGINDHIAEVAERERLEVFGNEEDATPRQLEFVLNHPVHFVRLCEYSTASIDHLLNCLARREGLDSIQLLMASPNIAGVYQAESRIRPALERLPEIFPEDRANERGLQIRCYSEPASMRGRNFSDRLIVMGWYTYHRRVKKREAQLWGHVNALVWTPCGLPGRPEGDRMRDMFEEVFQALWEKSPPLYDAWEKLLSAGYREEHKDFPDDDWLKTVSS